MSRVSISLFLSFEVCGAKNSVNRPSRARSEASEAGVGGGRVDEHFDELVDDDDEDDDVAATAEDVAEADEAIAEADGEEHERVVGKLAPFIEDENDKPGIGICYLTSFQDGRWKR